MESKYTELLAETSLKKYSDIVPYCLKLEVKISDLNTMLESAKQKIAELEKKLEAKNRRTTKKDYE